MPSPDTPPVDFFNISYLFNLIYQLGVSGTGPSLANGVSALAAFAGSAWLLVSILSYLFSLGCIAVLVYFSIRYQQVFDEASARYGTISKEEAHEEVEQSRWARIRQLIESPNENDWRQAIIEADIMLDEMLTRHGYQGVSVGDKLKTANPEHFRSLQDAWNAHNVRNNLVHRSADYHLSAQIAYRAVLQYENVFKEFGEI